MVFLGKHFARYLADAAAGSVPGDLIFKLLATLTLSSLVLLLPFAFYLAILLAFGRFYKDNEMTVMAACGVSFGRIIVTIFTVSTFFAVLVAALSLYVSPWAVEQGLKLREQAEAKSEFAGLVAGQFRDFGGSNQRVYYIESLSDDNKTMHNIFVQNGKDGVLDIFSARSGYQYVDKKTGDRFLALVDGYRYEGIPGQKDFKINQYQKSAVRIEQREVTPSFRKRTALTTAELLGATNLKDIAELQWRISMPISVILLGVLAVFLSRTNPRQGKYAKLFGAALMSVVYNNLLGVAQSWVEQGKVSTSVGMWWVHGLLVVLIVILFLKQYGIRYLFGQMSLKHG